MDCKQEISQYIIAADIGGTFARFCRINLHNLRMDSVQIYACADFNTIETAFIAYQKLHALENITLAALAIASPITGDFIRMTNCHWHFSIQELQHKLALNALKVINDFTAIAMSLPILDASDLLQIGSGEPKAYKPKVVLGAGTGLGVACLMHDGQKYIACPGEGGHMDWGATTEQEWFIYSYLKAQYNHVSYERILSGTGLEQLYQAIAAYNKQKKSPLSALEIIALALNRQCALAGAAINQFFISLAAFAGDLALLYGAFGGVYLAGGIVPRLIPLLIQADFRKHFEAKGRFKPFTASIPTYIITKEQPGMMGAAFALKHAL